MNKLFFLFIIGMFLSFEMESQSSDMVYTFDDCTFNDETLLLPPLNIGGSPNCVCGLNAQSMELDGNNDFLRLPNLSTPIFDKDFTFDFYFWIDDFVGEIDIMSHKNACINLDSLMSLKYIGVNNELVFELSSNVNNYHSARVKLNRDLCWHRFTLVKFNLEYFVYIDNALISRIISREDIIFSRLGSVAFGDNPCNASQSKRFKGRIDEVALYNVALSELEVKSIYQSPDQILTPNTTIFKGESIVLDIGTTCANTVSWTPTQYLDDPNILNPIATPDESTTYFVKLNNGTCSSTDSVRIFIADIEKLDCNNLLIPKAFTPNNDGLNDRFGISNTFLVDKLDYFEIYDRWGSKVWETKSVIEQWDGSFNNRALNAGMYIYKIKYSCKSEEKFSVNNFTLIR